MAQASNLTWKKVSKLSEQELDRLADLMGVSFLQDDLDKEEKVFILMTESEPKVLKALEELI